MYKITLNFPNLAKGAEVQIAGLGVFENGYEYVVSDEEAEAFRVHNQVVSTEVGKDDGSFTTTASPGPTLLQAFGTGKKSDRPVVVESYTPPADEPVANGDNQEGEGS